MAKTMPVEYTVSSKLAEVYVTLGSRRINAFNMIDFEATITKTKRDVPILGRTNAAKKATGWEGSGKATLHANTNMFKNLMYKYIKTGEDTYFTIQVTNEDPSSPIGRNTIILKEVNLDSATLVKFDAASDEEIHESIDFTFGDIEMPEKYKGIRGM